LLAGGCLEFSGKVTIVTDGSRGIGRAICHELASRGCDLAFNYAAKTEVADRRLTELQALGRKACTWRVASSCWGDVDRMVDEVKAEFGRIEFLVNTGQAIQVDGGLAV
jgi:3-oxoacyl-[acyl-carrier protein] reductase